MNAKSLLAFVGLAMFGVIVTAKAQKSPPDTGNKSSPFVQAGSRTFTIQNKHLIATDKRTGKRLWSFGNNIGEGTWFTTNKDGVHGLIVATPQRVYTWAMHTLYAVDARTGRQIWSVPSPLQLRYFRKRKQMRGFVNLQINGSDLFIRGLHEVLAFNAASGKQMWRMPADGNIYITRKVILMTSQQIDPMWPQDTSAYDRKTGKELWTAKGEVREFDDDKVTLEIDTFVPEPDLQTIENEFSYDVVTGKPLNAGQ